MWLKIFLNMNYPIKIKKAYKLKYSFFLDNSLTFINSFFRSRKKSISKINKLLIKKNIINVKLEDDFTFLSLHIIYKKILKKKKVYPNEILFIKKLYQKFEIFLKLRKKYSKKFIKITNSETNVRTYILLHILVDELNIAPLCKLNCQLKLNDKLYFYKLQNLDYFFLKLLKINITNEIKKIKKLI